LCRTAGPGVRQAEAAADFPAAASAVDFPAAAVRRAAAARRGAGDAADPRGSRGHRRRHPLIDFTPWSVQRIFLVQIAVFIIAALVFSWLPLRRRACGARSARRLALPIAGSALCDVGPCGDG